jgi:F0F1-type ATP synthase delta subunit
VKDNKQKRIEAIAKGVISYLEKGGEVALLSGVITELKKKLAVEDVATVWTPVEISAYEKKQAIRLVGNLVKKEKFEIQFKFDSEMIDGIKVKYKDQVWDLSMAGKLKTLAENFN